MRAALRCRVQDFYCGGFSCGAQALRHVNFSSCSTRGLVASWHVESSQTMDGTGAPCVGRQILKHWPTREVPGCNIFISRGSIAPCSTLGPLLEGENEGHLVVSDSLRPHGVHGIFQARILEWLFFPFSGDLPNPGIEPPSPTLPADSLPTELSGKPFYRDAELRGP